MGGTSGALYCIFLSALSSGLKSSAHQLGSNNNETVVDAKSWSDASKIALTSLESYTSARRGDRTLMDALIPFIHTFAREISQKVGTLEALRSAKDAAREGAQETRKLQARLGRASYVADESVKAAAVPDAGAWGVASVLNGIYEGLEEGMRQL